jgi:hypothetical protein
MIAKLYYLDDDFNDRELQTRHVWQMMTADLTRARLQPCTRSAARIIRIRDVTGMGTGAQRVRRIRPG